MEKNKILGIGSAVIEKVLKVEDHFLENALIKKGETILMEPFMQEQIISKADACPIFMPGGGVTHILKILAKLNHATQITGKVGFDTAGEFYSAFLKDRNVEASLVQNQETHTGQTLTLITPDNRKSYCHYAGASLEMSASDLSEDLFRKAKLVLIDADALLCDYLVADAMKLAKKHKAFICFNLNSSLLLHHHFEQILELLKNYVDLFICLGQKSTSSLLEKNPKEICEFFSSKCKNVVYTLNSGEGYYSQKKNIKSFQLKHTYVRDIHGSYASFIAGIIHGFIEKYSLDDSLKIATYLATQMQQERDGEFSAERGSTLGYEVDSVVSPLEMV